MVPALEVQVVINAMLPEIKPAVSMKNCMIFKKNDLNFLLTVIMEALIL